MKLLVVVALCAVSIIRAEPKNCKDIIEEECNETEYHLYVECIGNRLKRSANCIEECADCEDNCKQCDCDYCATNICQGSCLDCCPNNPPCSTNHCCHKVCHARCRSATCRDVCKSTCREMIQNITGIDSGRSSHNITTVINLHNVINNTNIIDVPIEIETNVDNFTVSLPEVEATTSHSQQNWSAQVEKEACCYIIGPKQCKSIENAPHIKCYHLRRKVCGAHCKAAIVHEQLHQVCNQIPIGTSCRQQVIYVPQPQPRCAYQPYWPYVSCGIPQQQFCGGCYAHYNPLYSPYPPQGCPASCYDDGYGVGPYYRQGPFYRPGYAHVPSCYQINACGFYDYGNVGRNYAFPSGYGGFGYPPQNFGGFGGVEAFAVHPNVNYPPYTYRNNIHIAPKPEKEVHNKNGTPDEVQFEDPVPSFYYPIPIDPQYSQLGYPYFPQVPPYNFPPEVDIQATITHPETPGKYAQITISKKHDNQRRKRGSK